MEHLFDEQFLKNKIRDKWITLYDYNFIDNEIIQGLLQKKEKLQDIINFIKQKIISNQEEISKLTEKKGDLPLLKSFSNSKSANKILTKKKLTIPEPFNLSLNKPKLLQEPIIISNSFKALLIPKNIKNISLLKIENDRKKRIDILKKDIIERTEKDRRALTLETEKRPNNIDKIRNIVEKDIEKNLKFNQKYSIPIKSFDKFKADVKYNEAAILKEEYMIEKKNKEEEEQLNKILIEKKDRKEFDRWVNEMRIKDDIENMEKIDKRKIELMLNREISSNYYNLRRNRNMEKYMGQKLIGKKNNDLIKKEKEEDMKNKKDTAEKIKKEVENGLLQKLKTLKEKQNIYQKRKKEFDELNLLSIEENKLFKEKRDHLVSQIRTLEKIPKKRETGFDPTETSGYGLLGEMSLAELRERLALQKQMRLDELNSKKEENKLRMKQRADDLFNKALMIQESRNKLKNMKDLERKHKKEQKETLNEKYKIERENNMIECKKKIEDKKKKMKKEDEAFMKRIREIKLNLQFNNVGKDQVEYNHNENNEIGLERKYNDIQNKTLEDKLAEEKINWEKIKTRFKNAKSINDYYQNIIHNYNNKLINESIIQKMLNDEDKNYIKAVCDKERLMKKYQKEDYREKNKLSEILHLNILKNKKVSKSFVVKNKYMNTDGNVRKIKFNDDELEEENYIRNKLETENNLDKI